MIFKLSECKFILTTSTSLFSLGGSQYCRSRGQHLKASGREVRARCRPSSSHTVLLITYTQELPSSRPPEGILKTPLPSFKHCCCFCHFCCRTKVRTPWQDSASGLQAEQVQPPLLSSTARSFLTHFSILFALRGAHQRLCAPVLAELPYPEAKQLLSSPTWTLPPQA